MNDEELYYELEKLHDEGKHKEIISLILSLSEEQLNDDIKGLLAVAYNNAKEFDLAIETLNSLSEDIKNHHTWFYKIAYAYSGKEDAGNANINIDRALYMLEMNKSLASDEEYNYFNNLYNNLKEYIKEGSVHMHYEANAVTDFSSDKQFFFLVQDDETYTPYPYENDEIYNFIMHYSNIVLNSEETEEAYNNLEELAEKLTKDYTLASDLFLFLPEICADNQFFDEVHSNEVINFNFETEEKNISVYKTQLYTYHLINNYIFELFREGAFGGKENEVYIKFINMSALHNIYLHIKEDYEKKNKKLENAEVNLTYNVSDYYEIR